MDRPIPITSFRYALTAVALLTIHTLTGMALTADDAPDAVARARRDALIAKNLAPLLLEEGHLLESHGPEHPEVRAVRKQIEVTERLLGQAPPRKQAAVSSDSRMLEDGIGHEPQSAAPTGTWTLRWTNGDELAGHPVSAAEGQLVWHSDVLARPVSLDLEVLQSVTGPDADGAATPVDEWRFSLSTGDVIFGNLIRIEPEQLVIESTRHGSVSIQRNWIRQFSRTSHRHPVDLIKAAGSGWQSLDPAWNQKGSGLRDWSTDEPRVISTRVPGARLFFPSELPEKCLIELNLVSGTRLGFSLALGGIEHLKQRTGDLEIETWGDELVVQSASSTGEFEHLQRLTVESKTAAFRVYWDRTAGHVFIYDEAGRLIVDADVDRADEDAARGVLLENKGEDLSVEMLRISNWNGQPSPGVIAGLDRLRTIEGGEHHGHFTGPDADGMLTIDADSPEGRARLVRFETVQEVVFATAEPEAESVKPCTMEFLDGTIINGSLTSIDRGIAEVGVPYLESDMNVDLQRLRECMFSTTARDAAGDSSHVLEYSGLQLHGQLAPAETALGWQLVGSDDVIALSTDSTVRIRRLEDAGHPADESSEDTDVAYFRGGDQVPCRVNYIDEESVTLTTSLAPATQVPRSALQAVEFDVRRLAQLSSFTGPGWITNGVADGERTRDRIVFTETAHVYHPNLLRGGMCEFDVEWEKKFQTLMFLSLTADGEPFGNSRQMFYLIFNGNSVQVHTRSGRGAQRANVSNQPRTGKALSVRLESSGERISLVIDDAVLGTLERPDPQSPTVGVTIGVQPMNARKDQPKSPSRLVLSNIRTGRGDGLFRGIALTQLGREHIVTIPRSRRNNPPTTVLVAQNGDLLRGDLLAMDRQTVAFRSRLEEVYIPVDRLAGIVFPPQPEEEETDPPPRPPGLIQTTLNSGVVLNLIPTRVSEDEIIGTHPVLGACHLKLSAINELRTGELMSEGRRRIFTEWTLVRAPEPIIPDPNAAGEFGTYSEMVGQSAADFSLPMLDGGEFRLSEHSDKIVVLDFWASWCGPCIQALPQLASATGAFSHDDVLFIAVNQRESTAVIRQFLETRGWDFPVALDEDGAVGGLYQVEGIPQTVVVGRGGRIEHVHLGASSNLEAELTETLQQLLEGDGEERLLDDVSE